MESVFCVREGMLLLLLSSSARTSDVCRSGFLYLLCSKMDSHGLTGPPNKCSASAKVSKIRRKSKRSRRYAPSAASFQIIMWGTSRSIAAHQQGGSSPLAHATTAITVAEAKAEAVKVAYAKSAHLKGERGEKAKEEAAEQKAAVEAAEQDELQELQDMFGGGARGSPVPASLYAKFRVKCEMRAKVEEERAEKAKRDERRREFMQQQYEATQKRRARVMGGKQYLSGVKKELSDRIVKEGIELREDKKGWKESILEEKRQIYARTQKMAEDERTGARFTSQYYNKGNGAASSSESRRAA